MKLRCAKDDLLSRIQIVQRAVSSRNTLPLLSGIYLSTEEKDGVMLCGTDMELSIRTLLPAEIEEHGQTVIPARTIGDIARNLPEAAVDLIGSNGAVKVSCEQSEFQLRCLPPEEFPLPSSREDNQGFTIDAGRLADTIRRVARSASKDESRPILTGVLVNIKDQKLEMVATDSYRLAIMDSALPAEGDAELSAVIPARALEELARIASLEEVSEVKILAQDNQVVFGIGGVELSTRTIEGAFPDYRQLLPEGFEINVTLERDSLMRALRRVAIVAGGSPLKLKLSEGKVSLFANSQDVGDAHEAIEVDYDGSEVEIAFNPQYVLDGAQVVTGEQIVLRINSAVKPALLQEAESDDFRYLIMPVRIT